MGAFDTLSRTITLINRPPGLQKSSKGSHVLNWRTTAARGHSETRNAFLVEKVVAPDLTQFLTDDPKCFFPGNGYKTRILIAALSGIGPLHRLFYPMRVVGFLNEAIGLDTYAAAARVLVLNIEVRNNSGCEAVLNLDLHQIGSRRALITVHRDGFHGLRLGHVLIRRASPSSSAAFADPVIRTQPP